MGGLFGPHHQTGSQNSKTLSPRVSCQGVVAVIFRTRGPEKLGI